MTQSFEIDLKGDFYLCTFVHGAMMWMDSGGSWNADSGRAHPMSLGSAMAYYLDKGNSTSVVVPEVVYSHMDFCEPRLELLQWIRTLPRR